MYGRGKEVKRYVAREKDGQERWAEKEGKKMRRLEEEETAR